MKYGYKKTIENNFEDTEKNIKRSLLDQGFGVITEIDVKNTFKQKLDLNFKKYKILGACQPQIAYEALSVDKQIGLLLPCNVVLWENENKSTTVAAIDSRAQLSLSGNEELTSHAAAVNEKLRTAVDNL